jgi:RNA polymerase sigma-70 factor (ECF subfamily)
MAAELAMHGLAFGLLVSDRMPGGVPTQDPAALLVRVASERDRAALSTLFGIYGPRVKSMLLKQGADNAMAEDLVQETFVSVWRKADQYSPERGAPSTWIVTIARNLRIDFLRKQSSKPYVDIDGIELAADLPLGSQLVEQSQVVGRVGRAIKTLSPEQAEVVRLSFVLELPHAEIARRIGIPLGTVKSRLRLAYDRLRPLLEDLH